VCEAAVWSLPSSSLIGIVCLLLFTRVVVFCSPACMSCVRAVDNESQKCASALSTALTMGEKHRDANPPLGLGSSWSLSLSADLDCFLSADPPTHSQGLGKEDSGVYAARHVVPLHLTSQRSIHFPPLALFDLHPLPQPHPQAAW
jgi:hypothetical protein